MASCVHDELSEVDVVVERSGVRDCGGAEDGPLVVNVCGRDLLERPTQVRREERRRPRDRRQLVVIEKDDTSRADETPQVDEVDEDALEAVVALDEREVEFSGFVEEARQRDLRLLSIVFYHARDPGLIEELQPAIREPRGLVGIDGDVAHLRTGVPKQALADVKRRDTVTEADLDRPPRPLPQYPIAQRLTLGSVHRDREEAV